jgi:Tfp pilus assembly pilus retraction ATPase PilT
MGSPLGMQTMNQSLADNYASGKISKDVAMEFTSNKEELERIIASGRFIKKK